MFRRRPFRPPLFRRPRPGAPPPVGPRVRAALQRANRALERGDTAEAARIFHRLADAAARRGMPLRAAAALSRAAYAEALGNAARPAVEDGLRALDLATRAGRPERITPAVERVVEALRENGHEAEATELEQRMEAALEQAGTSRQEVMDRLAVDRQQRRGRLPAKCTSCGAPLLPDEVEWHDAETAVCPYCGSAVKAV